MVIYAVKNDHVLSRSSCEIFKNDKCPVVPLTSCPMYPLQDHAVYWYTTLRFVCEENPTWP